MNMTVVSVSGMRTGIDSVVRVSPAGLSVHGRDEVLLCASLFPFRIPREEWKQRLDAVRDSGYQVIDVYLPWNFHELAPGEWDFTGRRDVGVFLDLARDAGLAVIARPGPYICSEWDGGALPAWLTLEDGLRIRDADPQFLSHVEQWFARALPIIADRQADVGGAVIAVQLENELDFFDTADRPGYLTALRDLALASGITVPLIACAGQGDMSGATGGVDGVVPTFNFYPDDDWSDLEPLVRRYADMLAEQRLPLLVTETNRAHRTLRRLLVSGARVIAPYLQASGYNFGYTPRSATGATPAASCRMTTTSTVTCHPTASHAPSTPRHGFSPRSSAPSAQNWPGRQSKLHRTRTAPKRRPRHRPRASCSMEEEPSSAFRTWATLPRMLCFRRTAACPT